METIRAFIAVDIGDAVREQLSKLQRQLRHAHADIKWMKPENIHLTLAFLGETSIDLIRPLETALEQMLEGQKAFEVHVEGTGTFGKPKHPRVVWTGLEESPALTALQKTTVKALEAAEIELDEKPFAPHLTIGRIKSPKHVDALYEELEKEKTTPFEKIDITEVQLIRSVLKPYGAEYRVLQRVALT